MKQEIIFMKKQNKLKLMGRKHKKFYTTLNYIEHFLLLSFTITGCISIFAFGIQLGTPIGITRSIVGLEICAITARIKNQNSLTQKKRSMIRQYYYQKLNSIEVLISLSLIDSNINHEEVALISILLKEYDKDL